MKKMQLLIAFLLYTTISFAQIEKEKWKGLIGSEKCTLEYSIKTVPGAEGFEESITYKGTLTIGTKNIPIVGWFEGNAMRFQETINGTKKETLYFDLSSGPEGKYTLIGKRAINGKINKIKLYKTTTNN